MPDDQWRWRPEPWWLAVGGLAGLVWGVVAGGLWMGIVSWGESWEGSSPLAWFFLGAMFGAMFGTATGLGVGAVLTFVVGRDRPARTARPLAAVTALVATPVLLTFVFGALSGDSLATVLGLAVLLVSSGIVAAATSWWFAPKMERRPRLVSQA